MYCLLAFRFRNLAFRAQLFDTLSLSDDCSLSETSCANSAKEGEERLLVGDEDIITSTNGNKYKQRKKVTKGTKIIIKTVS